MATGRKSGISTSAVQLTGTSTPVQYGVSVKAAYGNAGKVYVGLSNAVTADANDATDGYELSAGEEVFIPAALLAVGVAPNANGVYVIGSAATQKVFWVGA